MIFYLYLWDMKLLKRIFKSFFNDPYLKPYKWELLEMDYGDATIGFTDGNVEYIIDLDWDDGIIDVEFGVVGAKVPDTTNLHNQYRVLTTVAYATRRLADGVSEKTGYKFHSVSFKSSDWRNGKIDERSRDIRNRFFARYAVRQFPNAEVTIEDNIVLIKLNRV